MVKVKNKTKVKVFRDKDVCKLCGFCHEYVCRYKDCISCGACVISCPYQAMSIGIEEEEEEREIKVFVDGKEVYVRPNVTIKCALEDLGFKFFAPCSVGGCFSCALLVNGKLEPICVTKIEENMRIETEVRVTPLRLIQGFSGHMVGGVGTPWEVKKSGYVEVACFSAGCNLRCPQCLPFYEKILVKINGKTQLLQIGELFQRECEEFEDICGFFKPKSKLEVVSLNPKELKICWSPVTHLIKRKGDGKVLKMRVETGHEINVSLDHPIVVVNNSSNRLRIKKACKLDKIDYLLIPKFLSKRSIFNLTDVHAVNVEEVEILDYEGEFFDVRTEPYNNFLHGDFIFTHNCQNWTTTYWGKGKPITPKEAALNLTLARKMFRVSRMAISGGESTLNKPWLLEFLKELKKLNPDKEAKFHVDTNGTLLTPYYIDELKESGMTDIGIDLKALRPETYSLITGIEDIKVCGEYLKTSWDAVKYIIENHEDIFCGVGIPYNKELISERELEEIGKELYKIKPDIQICVLDYRPEFRRLSKFRIERPTFSEMKKVRGIFVSCGLKKVIAQTPYGHIGPDGELQV